jgi:hypothetical protein
MVRASDFFHGREGFSTRNDFYDEDAEQFSSWRSRCAQQTRREEIKIKYDSRDRKAKSWSKDKRMFCGVNQGITKGNAVISGLYWELYNQHQFKYRTCWACLRDHTSVMTKKMDLKKIAKRLDCQVNSRRPGQTTTQYFGF